MLQQLLPFTVLKLLLTVWKGQFNYELQQLLPFTVLKLQIFLLNLYRFTGLQQLLPFTVLKQVEQGRSSVETRAFVATALTVYGIETGMFLRQATNA